MEGATPVAALGVTVASILASAKNGKQEELSKLASAGIAEVAALRAAHLRNCYKTDDLKKAVAQLKNSYEESSVTLENVRYERSYYDRLISANMDFQSAFTDEQVSLRPLAEFEGMMSADLRTKIDALPDKDHAVMLERLKLELEERKGLKQQLESVQSKKRQIQSQADKKKRKLDKMLEQVSSITATATPALSELELENVSVDALLSKNMQHLLPRPLFILYSQLQAANEVFGLGCKVGIVSSERAQEHKSKRKRGSGAAAAGAREHVDVHQADAFQVTLELADDDAASGGGAVVITFAYVPMLNVATASAADAAGTRLLDSLYPHDEGVTWPHDVSAPIQESSSQIHVALLPGKPYKWCQYLAGLDLLMPPPDKASLEAAATGDSDMAQRLVRYRSDRRAIAFVRKLKQRRGEMAALM